MIGKRIPQLPLAGPLDGTEQTVLEQGGRTKRVLFTALAGIITYIREGVGALRRSIQDKLRSDIYMFPH